MFKRVLEILSVACLTTSIASAQSPFIGEWKLDASKTRLPDEMKVQHQGGNTFVFDVGGGAETIVVDGTDQPGYGGTLLSVKAEAADTWIVKRKNDGRLLLTATWKLSNDSTLMDYFRGLDADGSTFSVDYIYRRIGGGTGFAADWQSIEERVNSPFVMEVTAFRGDGLSFVSPLGTRSAEFPEKSHPTQSPGGARGAASSIRRVDERTLVITGTQNGRVTVTQEIALSTDLEMLTMTVHVPGRDRPNVLVFERK